MENYFCCCWLTNNKQGVTRGYKRWCNIPRQSYQETKRFSRDDSMFPPTMPPVESFPGMRSKGSGTSSGASSKMGHHNMLPKKAKRGVTMYDNEGPKTEL